MLNRLLSLWLSLAPEEQAALIGALVSVLIGVVRKYRPAWFASAEDVARWSRMMVSILTCGVAVLVQQLTGGTWVGLDAYLVAWLAAYMGAEATHTLTARTAPVLKGAVTVVLDRMLVLTDWG